MVCSDFHCFRRMLLKHVLLMLWLLLFLVQQIRRQSLSSAVAVHSSYCPQQALSSPVTGIVLTCHRHCSYLSLFSPVAVFTCHSHHLSLSSPVTVPTYFSPHLSPSSPVKSMSSHVIVLSCYCPQLSMSSHVIVTVLTYHVLTC